MKKLFTLLAIYFLAIYPICSIKAADVSVVEDYSHATKQGQQNSTLTYDGNNHTWKYRKVRINNDKMTDKATQAIWFSRYFNNVATEDSCYIGCEEVEGGIKKLEFSWKQANASDENKILCLNVEINDERVDSIRVTGGDEASSYMTSDQSYSKNLAVKSNAKLVLLNKSHVGDVDYAIANGRLFVGPITITPYLYYMQKSVTIGLPNKGYINRNLINNTGGGAITYSIDNDAIAEINGTTGAITPKAAGTTWVRAHWGDVSTSYELTVDAHIYLEAFSKNESYDQLGRNPEGTWDGDVIASWNGKELRRDAGDTIGYFIQGTWMRTLYNGTGPQAYLKSANELEGGMKALSFNWRQWGSGADCSLQMCASYGGTPVKTSDAMTGVSSEPHVAWPFEYEDESEGDKTNEVLEIKNISTRGGNKDPRIVISGITITPWLLYYTKECTLDMQVASADPTRTFKNEDLIDNTIGTDPTYEITNYGGISNDKISVADDGTVSVADRFQTGDIEVQAKWSKVTTTYTLHVLGKTASNASFTNAKVYKDISDGSFTIACSKDAGTPSYTSSNTSIATVNPSTGEVTLVGVGQDTITATITESETVGGSTAYYILYVTDNSENVQVEHFSNINDVTVADALANPVWEGDLFDWRVLYAVRRNNDKFPSDISSTTHFGTWMSIPDPVTNYATLQSEDVVEGGIKYLWFYWEQWGTETNRTLKLNVYTKSEDEEESLKSTMAYKIVGETVAADPENRMLFGVSDLMRSNRQLIIKNASHNNTGTRVADRCRVILDDIHITPYLLYTEKSATLDTRDGTKTYKNTSLIDNTEGGNISYTSSDPKVATVDSEGIVTAKGIKGGTITITATWDDEGAGAFTTYELTVIVPEVYSNKETFNSIITTANYTTLTDDDSKQGDVATWSTLLGGFNPDAGDAGRSVEDNCARFKARYSNETGDLYPFIQSSTIPGGIKSLRFKCQAGGNESTMTWIIKVYINEDEFSVPAESIPTNANQGWKSIEISDINVAGDFVIRFENQSTISDYTSGNKGRLLIDDIEWEGLPMALKDNESNAALLGDNNGYKRNVMLADRTIRTGGYNTLCLPFAMSEEQLAESPLKDGKVFNFTNAYLGAENLDIRFEKVTAMEAGKPYLVTVPADVENPVFEGVSINNSTEKNIVEGANMRFIGSFNQETMHETGLYVVANSLYRVNALSEGNRQIGACRAYFDVLEGAPAVPAGVRMRITEEEVATDLVNVQSDNVQCTKVMENGVLYLMYKGTKYNVQGARVR